jgi:predicted HTH transcriptional regulator
MSEKHWIKNAATCLEESLYPVPHESNEIDWKINLSENKERLTEHLIAFANHANGGFMVFGVSDSNGNLSAITQDEAGKIINTLANIGRDAIEPPLILDHAIVEFKNTPILFVYITEQKNKPVHRRGKSIEASWIRSGGTTRKASRHDVGSLMLNSSAPTWEELRA